jgi:hypothetical protein
LAKRWPSTPELEACVHVLLEDGQGDEFVGGESGSRFGDREVGIWGRGCTEFPVLNFFSVAIIEPLR